MNSMTAYNINHLEQIEKSLDNWLPEVTSPPGRLHEAMRYSVFAGGKRLRPRLALAVCENLGADPRQALAPAAALEMIHTYSLIHDDLPAMDDDDMRRGQPTSHKVFGEDFAILAGDGLLTQAFSVVAEHTPEPLWVPKLVKVIADKSGWAGMVGGQVADIASSEPLAHNKTRGLDQVKFIHLRKTAALISASCECGAICAGADDATIKRYAKMGETLGLAFQIIDDILDLTADSATLGKTAGKDERDNKLTYPAVLGIEQSKKIALALEQEVMETLNADNSEDHRRSAQANALKDLVKQCIHRKF